MDKKFCDLCGQEALPEDVRKLKIELPDGKPAIKEKTICVFCKEKLVNLLNNLDWTNPCAVTQSQKRPGP